MSSIPVKRYSFAEYLALERAADYRSEFFQGEIFAMAGGSERHARIADNILVSLRRRLRGGNCMPYSANLRVMVKATGLTTYPDVSVVCGPAEFDDAVKDTLLNPTVLIEVLSPSTERYDRGRKWANYQQILALQQYLLVDQDEARVELFARQESDQWLLTIAQDLAQAIDLPALGCSLPLSEIYDGVL